MDFLCDNKGVDQSDTFRLLVCSVSNRTSQQKVNSYILFFEKSHGKDKLCMYNMKEQDFLV